MAFLDTLLGLSLQKKITAAIAVGIVALAMGALIKTASQPPMALLYAGVDASTAGEIVTKLDAEAVAYKVEGERIYVEAPSRDRLRLTLAQEGLPRQSITGYELLDDLSGFSTTSDMFSAAYWRAKEGELTRTLLQMPGIRAARVHIGADQRSPFERNRAPRSASVTVTAPAGLSSSQVKAIQHMTALSVSNMRPDSVAVIDTNRGLLTNGGDDANMAGLDEDKRASSLEATLIRLVEARVGPGNARVSVSMQVSRQREAISEQLVDPDTAVVTSRSRSESRENETGRETATTVASDLPDGDANAGADESTSERTETREEVAYAVTTRDRTIERLPGEIERLTIAVLLDHLPALEGEEATRPRPAEEITALKELIETAAGVDAARGDKVTIQSLAFERPVIEDIAEEPATVADSLAAVEPRLWHVGQLALLSVVVLILGLFVVKPILTQGGNPAALANPALTAASPVSPGGMVIEDPVTMLRAVSTEESDDAAALLNAWLEEEEVA
ncbi:MAG: flagellar basal-body MS-ring/collar protein FliF [Pseudomonadota bacterium]